MVRCPETQYIPHFHDLPHTKNCRNSLSMWLLCRRGDLFLVTRRELAGVLDCPVSYSWDTGAGKHL